MQFNSLLADQLSKLELKPSNLAVRKEAQKPRCMCCNRHLDQCRKLCLRDAQHRPGPIDNRTVAERVADVRAAREVKVVKA